MCWGRACGGTDRGWGTRGFPYSSQAADPGSFLRNSASGLKQAPMSPASLLLPTGNTLTSPTPLSVPPHYVVRPRPLPTPQNSCMIGKKEPYRLKQPGSTHGLRPRCFPPVVHHNQLCGVREIRVSGFSRTVCAWSGQARLVRSRRTLSVKRPNTRFPNPAERPS